MNYLVNFFKIIFYSIISISLLLVVIYYLEINESSLTNGYYKDFSSGVSIKSTKDENLFIGEVLDYSYNDTYIIIKIYPRIDYECKGYTSMYFIKKIQYLIIETQENIIWETHDKDKFDKKLSNLKITLKFNMKDKELNKYIENNRKWLSHSENNIKDTCTKNIAFEAIKL